MRVNKWLILLAVAIPSLMIEMAGTSVFVGFEVIATDLNVGMDKSVWLSTLYLAVNAMMIPLAGWLGRKLGYKRVIFFGVVIFTLSSLLCALARDFESLVVFRALQGLGDGPIMPVATALLLEVFPARQRGRMMTGLMLAYSIAPALGPLIASWLIDSFDNWRAIFYMNVIWGMASILAVSLLLPSMKPSEATVKVNWTAFILLAIGTGSLQLFLDRGDHLSWFDSGIISALFITAVVSLALYLIITFATRDKSVLDMGLLKNVPFMAGNLANMVLMGALYGVLMIKVFYLQWILGFTVLQSGIYQAVLAGSMLIFSIIAGILTDKINPRWLVIAGLPVTVYSLSLATGLGLYSDMNSIMFVGIVLGAGLALVSTPISITVFSTVKSKDMAAATVMNSYLFVVSAGVSLALVTIFLMHRIDVNTINLSGAVTVCNPAIANAMVINPTTGLAAAYTEITRQGAMFGFIDVWYLMAFILILILLYLPYMKRATEL
ncbi:MAG TPA: DHA2 family efflux MFS transporter permease subunit [Bacteroidales bacterium]|nr:DHA2 family efflux MFS transporter permease subunit [Bacteroidales bacterium]